MGAGLVILLRTLCVTHGGVVRNGGGWDNEGKHAAGLAVMFGEVGQSGDGWVAPDGAVGSVVIAEVAPAG
jgi:hypothetical protein